MTAVGQVRGSRRPGVIPLSKGGKKQANVERPDMAEANSKCDYTETSGKGRQVQIKSNSYKTLTLLEWRWCGVAAFEHNAT
jgi:hypothetical protein